MKTRSFITPTYYVFVRNDGYVDVAAHSNFAAPERFSIVFSSRDWEVTKAETMAWRKFLDSVQRSTIPAPHGVPLCGHPAHQ